MSDSGLANGINKERFAKLKQKVLVKRPVLEEIIQHQGRKSVSDYAYDYVSVNLNPTITERQEEFLAAFREEVARTLGDKVALECVRQLEKYYFVSTADHHGPICHPFWLNANMVIAQGMVGFGDPLLKNLIVLSCSRVSLNNHTFPRGILFNSYANGKTTTQKLAFLPSNSHSMPVYNYPSYQAKDVDKMKGLLKDKVKAGEVNQKEADKLNQLFDEIYLRKDVLEAGNYADQITISNYDLWKKFFGHSYIKMPNMVYVEYEAIVNKLLIKHHIYEDTILNHILFDPAYEDFLVNYFEGIFGCFSRKDQAGTYLFWAYPKGKKQTVQLWRKGNYLVSADESYKVELTPDAIKKGIEDKELIPSLFLNFATICFYYGLKCLGGFNQVNYLTNMKNGYIKMNVDLGNYRSIEVCARAQTKELCDGIILAFAKDPAGKLSAAYGPDFYLYGNGENFARFIDVAKNVTFEESLDPLLPEMYRITYDESEWDKDLINITEHEITSFTGLDKKIKPCLELN